jgi:hypothetical protein
LRSPTLSAAALLRGAAPILAAAALLLGCVRPAPALVRIDFEQAYYVHPGRQVWDFSILREGETFHIFYHTIPETDPGASNADTLWHSSSDDLRHWAAPHPVITSGPASWKAEAVWAPDVVRLPGAGLWMMAYTGCDGGLNQRIGMAYSPDLSNWVESDINPVVQPDSTQYIWSSTGMWSDFRDPFVYQSGNLWHMLVTAKKQLDVPTGVVYHATSADLVNWSDVGPLFTHDGDQRWRVLESCQYHVIGQTHHLLFGEFDTSGVTVLSAASPDGWTMADRRLLDYGYAPEVDEIEPGVWLYARLAPYLRADDTTLAYVVRADTLTHAADGSDLAVFRPHPLDRDWAYRIGTANLGNPVFEDNPVWRGEPSVGHVGHGWYGSAEYYQGPLSGRGAPGTRLGDSVTGRLESRPFTVTGNRMRLLVGGGHYPETCYVALVDTASGEILLSETGHGADTMTPRQWDLRPFAGRVCRIDIVDAESGVMGRINVDEIVEEMDLPAPVADLPRGGAVRAWRAAPNPFNPATTIAFELDRARDVTVSVHDLRGRLVWRSAVLAGAAGPNAVTWRGQTTAGRPAPAGSYVYRIAAAGARPVTGKISLVK